MFCNEIAECNKAMARSVPKLSRSSAAGTIKSTIESTINRSKSWLDDTSPAWDSTAVDDNRNGSKKTITLNEGEPGR